MAHRIAIGNNKGGTEKTTTVVRLAEALAKAGKRVGVVDMDPQGNASRRLGWKPTAESLTTSEAIEANAEGVAAQVWQPIGWHGSFAGRISLMPARYTLENRVTEAGLTGAYRRLAKALKGTDGHLDYVLIDCQPSLGHLTQMALAAAHYALASTEAEYDSLDSAVRYRDFLLRSGEDLANPSLAWLGVVVSAYDMRNGADVAQLAAARRIFGDDGVWGVIPRRSSLKNADEAGLPLHDIRDAHEVRACYELLAARTIKELP